MDTHREAATLARLTDLSFLEWNTVRAPTASGYEEKVNKFNKWLRDNSIEVTNEFSLDLALTEYLEDLYFRGYNHSEGDALMASLKYFSHALATARPDPLPRASRSLRGFRRLAPGCSRAPLPWVAVCAMAGAAVADGSYLFAVALILQFVCYLRPHELLNLKQHQVVEPVRGSLTSSWSLLLSPQELGRGSKTNQFDESVLVDWKELPALNRALKCRKERLLKDDPLWPFEHKEFNKLFVRYSEHSGVHLLSPHPYSVRHGGASHDALHQRRPLMEIKARGRWAADESVRRYNKHSRVLKEVSRLPEETREYGMWVMGHLNQLLDQKIKARQPPELKSKKLRKRKAHPESDSDAEPATQAPRAGALAGTRLRRRTA